MQKQTKDKSTWRTILISPEIKNWLLTEKGKRELITYDQVLRQLRDSMGVPFSYIQEMAEQGKTIGDLIKLEKQFYGNSN